MLTQELSRQQEILAEITRELITADDELMRFGLHLNFTYDMIQQTRTNHPQSVEGAALHLACLWWEDGMTTRDEKVPTLLEAVRAIGKFRQVGWVEKKLIRGIEVASVNVVGGIDQVEIEGTTVNVVGGIEQQEGATVNVAGGIDQVEIDGATVNVVGGLEQQEGATVNVADGIDQVEIEGVTVDVAGRIDQGEIEGASVNVVGRIDQGEIEGASVMVVDETEERHQAIVPVRERFVGSENPTDV